MKLEIKDNEQIIVADSTEIAAALNNVADALGDIAQAIEGSYNGTSKSAFWGIMQAMFLAVGEGDNEYDRGSLKVKVVKEDVK